MNVNLADCTQGTRDPCAQSRIIARGKGLLQKSVASISIYACILTYRLKNCEAKRASHAVRICLALNSRLSASCKHHSFCVGFYLLLTFVRSSADPADSLLALISEDMAKVDAVIAQRLATDVPLVSQISNYIISAGGKRLRPALLLLMSGALGYTAPQKYQLAAVVEFIHTATLLHDDVVDESTLRRGRPTANESFGNAASVLVGDFLYSRAFQMMVECGSMRVMSILAEATNVIAEGEVLQLMNMHDASLDEAAYLKVIRSKTAKLFEASSRLAAVLAGCDSAIEEACATYGQALGTAFQVIDDALDYEGNPAQMGKNLGDDLREGKVTLPLIIALRRASDADASLIRQVIEQPDALQLQQQLQDIMGVIHRTGALQATHAAARQESERASAALQSLPDSIYKAALLQLTEQSIARMA
jgi:octaprenyl-diphosphate synthase